MEVNKRFAYDKRTCDRYVEKGLVKPAELKSHLASLPDDSANAQYVQIDLHDAELPDSASTETTNLDEAH